MALPSRIVLWDAALDDGGASVCVAEDFQEAYTAYARDMASSMGMDEHSVLPEFVRLSGDVRDVHENGREGALVALWSGDVFSRALHQELSKLHAFFTDGEVPTYLVNVSSRFEAAEPGAPAGKPGVPAGEPGSLAGSMPDLPSGFRHMGSVWLGGGALFCRYRNAPRMGMVRHRVSETIDALVHAVMGGEALEPVRARLVMPRWRYERLSGSNRLGDEPGEQGRA
jgi:hypothetical protein